jgi:AcrR family transcriptional regulator
MAERGRPRSFERIDALKKAMHVFWCKGFEGASLSELTRAMGINSPSLYATFGSKEALFLEAVELYRQTDGAAVRLAINIGVNAKEAIGGLLNASIGCISTPKAVLDPDTSECSSEVKAQPTGCLIVLSALHCSNDNHNIQTQLSKQRRDTEIMLLERLLQGVADGEISTEVDAAAIARFYVTVLYGMSIQARDGACPDILRTIAHQAMLAWDTLTQPNPRDEDGSEG